MKRSLGALVGLAAVAFVSPSLRAADHRDSPTLMAAPRTDINDLFVWMQDDTGSSEGTPTKVNMALTMFRAVPNLTAFSVNIQYVFHITKHPAYGMPAAGETVVLCTILPSMRGICFVGPPTGGTAVTYVTNVIPGDEAGTTSADGRLKAFLGPRNDPFFFNLAGFNAVATAVTAALPGLIGGANPQGCPAVPAATTAYLRSQLGHAPYDPATPPDPLPAAVDDFATQNVLSIVVQLDKSLVSDAANPVIGVWASTNVPNEPFP